MMDSLAFSHAARRMSAKARALGLSPVPAFRSPPQRPDRDRAIITYEGGVAVAVRLRNVEGEHRPDSDVIRDMALGVLAVAGRQIQPERRGGVWSDFDLDLLEAAARGES